MPVPFHVASNDAINAPIRIDSFYTSTSSTRRNNDARRANICKEKIKKSNRHDSDCRTTRSKVEWDSGNDTVERYANREVIIELPTVGSRLNRPLRSRASNFTLAIPQRSVQHPANRIFEAPVITV